MSIIFPLQYDPQKELHTHQRLNTSVMLLSIYLVTTHRSINVVSLNYLTNLRRLSIVRNFCKVFTLMWNIRFRCIICVYPSKSRV